MQRTLTLAIDMPSVLAIVSKAVFEKSMPSAKVGDRFDTDRYVSSHKAFESMGGDDAIFLVTVRPPDERLWLVGVVEHPARKKDAWVGASNRVPIADVTAAIPKLAFSTGQGLHAKKGALGMSLQTPRILTEEDVRLLRGTTGASSDRDAKKKATKTEETRAIEAPPKERARDGGDGWRRATEAIAATDRQALVEALLARWREVPAIEIAEAIEGLAPLPGIDEVTQGTAVEARTRVMPLDRFTADPRLAMATARWAIAYPYHATSSQPFWRVVFDLLEKQGDPRVVAVLDPAKVPKSGVTMRTWMQTRIGAARDAMKARFPKGAPRLSEDDREMLASIVAQGTKLAMGAPRIGSGERNDASLLAAIHEHPDDDGARGVYADFLLERGDPRGEFITMQLARGRRAPTDDEIEKEMKLLKKHFREWLGDLVSATHATIYRVTVEHDAGIRFERGFVARTGLKGAKQTLSKLVGNSTLATLEELRFMEDADADTIASLVFHPVMRALVSLDVPREMVPRLPGTPLGDRLRELATDARRAGQAPSIVDAARKLPALERIAIDASGGFMGRGGRMVQADPTDADLESMASTLETKNLRSVELQITGGRTRLVPDGDGWSLTLQTWDRGGPLRALLEALKKRGIRRVLQHEGNTPAVRTMVKEIFRGTEIGEVEDSE